MSSVLEIARWYVSQGLSVIPVKADGSKSPALTGWRKYSTEIASEETLAVWFSVASLVGIGVVPGPASGNLVVLDFEHRDGESAYVEWMQRLPEPLKTLASTLPTVSTPSGGRHIWVRLESPQHGARLARYANGKTKIEIRGEGHQVLAPGCPAECHSTGQLYGWAIEAPVGEIDLEDWNALLEWCCLCNDFQATEQPRDRDSVGSPAGEDSPGNDFNKRGSWSETGLFDAGWSWARRVADDRGFLTRPGKETGISASIGMVSSKDRGYPYFYAWTTSTEFAAETPYSRFAVFASLKHKGNYSEAAKDLARLGYGERPGMAMKTLADLSGFTMKLNTPDGKPVNPFRAPATVTEGDPADSRPFKWMSELTATADDAKWIWKGYLPRGGITLFSAIWKAGKSTILSHLIRSLDGSVSQFLGLDVVPSRVLYIAEEDEKIWSGRRDSLLIGDHVGMWCRPFKVRPTMQEWRDHIKKVEEQVHKYQFDLVIYDTLSKMWPVREENDAGQVEEALMPLWNISNRGTSIMLVHHMRKSDGEQFVGARGSGGLPAFCEVLMEFRRKVPADIKDHNRIISANGRYNDIPLKLWCELTPQGYVSHGDPDETPTPTGTATAQTTSSPEEKDPTWQEDVYDILENSAEPLSMNEISFFLKQKRGKSVKTVVLLAEVNRLFESGEVERTGDGNRASLYMYKLVK